MGKASVLEIADRLHSTLWGGAGVSIDVESGDSPTGGYMVSTPGAELRTRTVPPLALIRAWLESVALPECALLRDGGFRPYIGGWVDNGHYYIDVSVCVGREEAARRVGREWRQVAIWDVTRGEAIALQPGE